MNLAKSGALLRRYWIALTAGLLIGVAGGAGLSFVQTPRYTSEAELFVSTTGAGNAADLAQGGSYVQQLVASYASIANSPTVLNPVIRELSLPITPADLAQQVQASSSDGTVILTVVATDPSPTASARLANAVASSLTTAVSNLSPTTDNRDAQVKLSLVRPAVAPSSPSSPLYARNIFLATLAGILLSAASVWVWTSLRRGIRTRGDLIEHGFTPLIGVIPAGASGLRNSVSSLELGNFAREAYRSLRVNLGFALVGAEHSAVSVTSALPGEGKSTTAVNLAISLAAAGTRVVLVDADLRRPAVARVLSIEGDLGLTDVLVRRVQSADAIQNLKGLGIHTLPSGTIPPNPTELLQSVEMRSLIARLRDEFDVVIIDSPPLLAVADAAVLAELTDGVLIVCRPGVTTRGTLGSAMQTLHGSGASVLGFVLNGISRSSSRGVYGDYVAYAPNVPNSSR